MVVRNEEKGFDASHSVSYPAGGRNTLYSGICYLSRRASAREEEGKEKERKGNLVLRGGHSLGGAGRPHKRGMP